MEFAGHWYLSPRACGIRVICLCAVGLYERFNDRRLGKYIILQLISFRT
jgi:hypothetical protein